MIKFVDIDCEYDIVDFKKSTAYDEIEDEDMNTYRIELISKQILLQPDSDKYNSIMITKHYDEYIQENAEDIISDVANRTIKWDLVCKNITEYPISISAVEGTTSDIDVIEHNNLNSIEEFNNIIKSSSGIKGYKFRRLLSSGEFVKLI